MIDDTLPSLSLKAIFQKILFNRAQLDGVSGLKAPCDFPLSFCPDRPGIIYHSAIAHKLRTLSSLSIEQSANKLVSDIMAPMPLRSNQRAHLTLQLLPAEHWAIHTAPAGWLALTVTGCGILTWLQQVSHVEVQSANASLRPAEAAALPALMDLSLCQRLQVSLPVFLQVIHARCYAWLSQFRPQTPSHSIPVASELDLKLQVLSVSTPQEPRPYDALLNTLIRVIDTMADHINDAQTYLRQAYHLAQAIYAFQAAVPVATVHQYAANDHATVGSLMQASQNILALVLRDVLQQIPANKLD